MAEIDWSKGQITLPEGASAEPDWDSGDILPPPPKAGAVRKLADLGLGFASGAVGASKGVADAFGADNAASRVLASTDKFLQSGLSDAAVADQQEQQNILSEAKGKGVYEGVKAGVKAFGVAPAQTMATGLGSIVPTVLAGVATRGATAPASLAAMGAMGAAQGAGSVKGGIYDEILQRHIAAGASESEAAAAAERAQAYQGQNAGEIAVGGALGLGDSVTGVNRVATSMLRRGAEKVAEGHTGGAIARGLKGAAGEVPLEAAQGGQQQYAQNVAAQREGFEADPWDNVASQATFEGLASMGPGAAFGVANKAAPAAPVQTKSEAMGINPADGPLSRSAAMAVDSGLTDQVQAQQAAQQQAEDVEKGGKKPAGQSEPAAAAPLQDAAGAAPPPSDAPTDIATAAPPLSESPNSAASAAPPVQDLQVQPETAGGADGAGAPAPTVPAGPAGQFATEDDARAYIRQQRRAGGTRIEALPLPMEDGSFGLATRNSPEYTRAEFHAKQQAQRAAGILDGDVLSKAGEPFKNRLAAGHALRKAGAGHVIEPVQGGFVVRKGAIDVSMPSGPGGVAAGVGGPAVAEQRGGLADAGRAPDGSGGGVAQPAGVAAPAGQPDLVARDAGGPADAVALREASGQRQLPQPLSDDVVPSADERGNLPERVSSVQVKSNGERQIPVGNAKEPDGRSLDATRLKGPGQTPVIDGQLTGNFGAGKAALGQRFGALDVPTQARVLQAVSSVVKDSQVLRGVMQSIPVEVMDEFVASQGPSKGLLGNRAMLVRALTSDLDFNVRGRAIDALMSSPAFPIAELSAASDAAGAFQNNGATVGADQGSRHAANPTPAAAVSQPQEQTRATETPEAQPRAPRSEEAPRAEVRTGQPASAPALARNAQARPQATALSPLESEIDRDLEQAYQQDVKDGIKAKRGMLPQPKEAKAKQSPLRSFLREAGIDPKLAADITGERGLRANQRLPGTFRKGGKQLDELVTLARERGFISDADIESAKDTGGTGRLVEMIQAELRGDVQQSAETADQAAERAAAERASSELERQAKAVGFDTTGLSEDQVATAVQRIERRREVARVRRDAFDLKQEAAIERAAIQAPALTEEQWGALDAVIDAADNASTEDVMRDLGFSEQEISDETAKRSKGTPEGGEVRGRADEPAASRPQGSAEARPRDQGREEGLTSPTRADIEARQERAERAARDKTHADKDAEQRNRADAQRGDFTLTGSDRATDANPGQADIFASANESKVANSESIPQKSASKPAKSESPAKIEDFGDELKGAKKMLYAQRYSDSMEEAAKLDVAQFPLSQTWPAPDYEQLIKDGADPFAVAWVRAARDEVPTKPSSNWKVKRWAAGVELLRDFSQQLTSGTITVEKLVAAAAKRPTLKPVFDKADLYVAVGHDTPLKGVSIQEGTYSYLNGVAFNPPKHLWAVNQRAKGSSFGNWGRDLATGDTKEAAIEAFKKQLASRGDEAVEKRIVKFELYAKRSTGEVFIGKKVGKAVAELQTGFKDTKSARAYMAEHQEDLEKALERWKDVPNERKESNSPRVGADHRNGADVSAQQFSEAFGFRGVQFGNYVEGPRRQRDLNEAYDALMDMAGIIGVPARALSLNGKLGLAFGARGSGKALAHYEPGNVVINLTKTEGAGSLAHEWWHALDNYFGKAGAITEPGGGYLTEGASRAGDAVRAEMKAAFDAIGQVMRTSEMAERAKSLDNRRSKPYWATGREMSARSFESYVIAKLNDQSASNDYLANIVPEADWKLIGTYPYPVGADLPKVRAAFDEFFRVVETKAGEDGNVVMFARSDRVAMPGTPSTVKALQAAVRQLTGLTGRLPNELGRVVATTSAEIKSTWEPLLGKSVRLGSEERAGEALAFFDPDTNTVFMLADRIRAGDEVAVLAHELMHKHGQTVLGKEGWDRLHGVLETWKNAPAESDERNVYNFAAARVAAAGAELSNQELFPYAVEAAIKAGIKPNMMAKEGTVARWLAMVRKALQDVWAKLTGKPETFNAQDLVDLAFGIAQMENPARAAEIQGATSDAPRPAETSIAYSRDASIANDKPTFSRGDAANVLKTLTVTDLKHRGGNALAGYRNLAMAALGRRQIVDLFAKDLPQLSEYNRLTQHMDADKNEAGAEADKLAERWGKLKDEGALASLMHDATLAQIDPSTPYVQGDDENFYDALKHGYDALSPEAKKVYGEARDSYRAHHEGVRTALRDRIERSEIRGERKAALLKQMDDEFFKAIKGVYFPLARFGQYVVVTRDSEGTAINVSRAETINEAEAMQKELRKAYPNDHVGKVLKAKEFNAGRDAVGRGFMESLYGALGKKEMDEAQRAELEDMLGQLYLSALPDLSWAKHGLHRKGTAGFSQDARRAFAQNMFHGARYLAKVRYSDLLENELSGMQKHVDGRATVDGYDNVKAQQVVDEMVKRHDSMMNPQSNALSTALTSFGFVFHLGLSPASAMVNLTQTALVAYPIMGAKWGFTKASAALLKASQQAAANKNDITSALSVDEKRAFDEAVRAGVVDVTMAHDLAGISQGEDAKVSWKLRPVMKWASFLFHHAEKFNRQVTFVASYRLARDAGASHGTAFEQAVKATYDGHFDYSASNRPRFMQGNVAKVVLLFKQYAQNMVYTLGRQGYLAVKGATPAERTQARKALGGLLALHASAAGVLGLPMVTTLLAAASMVGGSDDEPWDAEVAMRNMLADALGAKPAEILARGLSRATPWDISGRVGLDKLILPDLQEGLEGQRLGESAMAAALGPVAGIGISALKGLQEMADGNWARGLESMAPAVARGPIKALRYGTEGAIDRTGKPIVEDVGAAGVAGQALGFSPSEVRLATEAKSAIHQADDRLKKRRAALTRHYAMAVIQGDTEAADEAKEEIAAFNQKNPDRRINPIQLAQSVRTRRKQIAESEQGVYLPKTRRDALDAGRFGLVE